MPTSWTDNPVIAGSTRIKAVHITELRSKIDDARDDADLAAFPWTDDPLQSGTTTIRAIHFGEIRLALQDLWLRKDLGTIPAWSSGGAPTPGGTIRAATINKLRDWYEEYADSSNIPDPQGLVSVTFFPTSNSGGIAISDEWCQDAYDLLPTPEDGQLRPIRGNAISNPGNDAVQFSAYATAARTWRNNSLSLGYVMPQTFLRTGTPNGVLGPDGNGKYLTSPFIASYGLRAQQLATQIVSGSSPPNPDARFWIWNEPNTQVFRPNTLPPVWLEPGDGGSLLTDRRVLSAQVFGSLLYTTSIFLRDAGVKTICAAALNVVPGTTNPNGDYVYGYLDRALAYLKSQGITEYNWDEFCVTIETVPGEPVDSAFAKSVRDAIIDAQKNHTGNPKPVIVAEWGMTVADLESLTPPPPSVPTEVQTTYSALKSWFPTMFFYAHQDTVEPPGLFGVTYQQPGSNPITPKKTTPPPPDPPVIVHTPWHGVLTQLYA